MSTALRHEHGPALSNVAGCSGGRTPVPVMNRLDDRTKLPVPMSRLFAIAGILASLALAACGDDDDSTPTTGPAIGEAVH